MFERLMKDAQPKAEAIKSAVSTAKAATTGIFTRVAISKAVQASKSLAYKSLVNTVGVVLVLAKGKEVATQGQEPAASKDYCYESNGITYTPCPACGGPRENGECPVHGRR
jgi:hypothetical protein